MNKNKITLLNTENLKKMNFIQSMKVAINALGNGEVNTRPKRYTCKFMAPGLTSYPDENKKDSLWSLTRKVMNEMQKSFIGCPVVYQKNHDENSTPENFDNVAGGVVTEIWTDDEGWDNAAFIVWDANLKDLIDNRGFNVSCAYDTINYTEGGILNAIKYDHEVTEAQYIHLAIVDAPRQTGAKIFFNNVDIKNESVIIFKAMWKGNETNMKFFPRGKVKLNSNETEEEKKAREAKEAEEVKKNAEDKKLEDEAKKNEGGELEVDAEKAVIETPDGEMPLADLLKVWEAHQKEEEILKSEANKKVLKMEDEYKGVKISDMYEAFKKSEAKKNAVEETDEEKAAKAAEAKKNAAEEEAKKNADKAKEEEAANKHFNALNSARDKENITNTLAPIMSKDDRIQIVKESKQY